MAALVGIAEILPKIGNPTIATVLKWKQEYESFPIRKLGAQWVSEENELIRWFQLFCTDRLHEFKPKQVKKSRAKQRVNR